MSQFITKGDDLIAESTVHFVFVNDLGKVFVNDLGKPTKIPDILFQDFKPYFCDCINV